MYWSLECTQSTPSGYQISRWVSIRNLLKLAFVFSTLVMFSAEVRLSRKPAGQKKRKNLYVYAFVVFIQYLWTSVHSVQPTCEFRPQKLVRFDTDALLMVLLARVRSVFRKAWTSVHYSVQCVFPSPLCPDLSRKRRTRKPRK